MPAHRRNEEIRSMESRRENPFDNAMFYLVNAVIAALFLLNFVEGLLAGSYAGARLDTALNVITIAAVLTAMVLRRLTAIPAGSLYAASLTVSSLNILLTMASSVEQHLMLDLMVLMALSIMVILFVLPSLGVVHGLISGIWFGIFVLRNSGEFSWSSHNFTTIFAVYNSLILLVAYFRHRQRSDQERERPATAAGDSHRLFDDDATLLMLRMIEPMYLKSGNAVATSENLGGVLGELRDDLRSSQAELLTELYGSLDADLRQLHRGIRVLSSVKELKDKSSERQDLPAGAFARSVFEDFLRQEGLPGDALAAFGAEELRYRVNREVYTSLLLSLCHYARFSGDLDSSGGVRVDFAETDGAMIIAYRPPPERRSASGAISPAGGIGSRADRNTEILYLEFLASVVLGGRVDYSREPDTAFSLHLPL
jgi:hypothetical protein